ncbi:hypothetical protein Hanom_Chr11g00979841 [Helianthus anomalus]
MKGVGKEMAKYLGDFQFGVGIPCGAEAVLHSANRFLNEYHQDGSLAMLTVDFSNAFNLVDRTALLYELDYMWGMSLFGLLLAFSRGTPWGPSFLPLFYTPLFSE